MGEAYQFPNTEGDYNRDGYPQDARLMLAEYNYAQAAAGCKFNTKSYYVDVIGMCLHYAIHFQSLKAHNLRNCYVASYTPGPLL